MRPPTLVVVFAVAGALLLVPLVASAQEPTLRDPVFDEQLEEQLTDDIHPIPAGMGAVLVPTLTGASLEPQVSVYEGDARIAMGRTGERIVLPPGSYQLVAGHGPPNQRPRKTVVVNEGMTTPVKPFFGAVRIHLVSDQGRPIDGNYVLKSLDVGTVYGPVRMTTDADGPRQASWIVPPGRYRVTLGTDPNADEGAVAFVVPAGSVLRYRLVVEAGDLVRADLADEDFHFDPSILRLRWVMGGSLALDSRNDQLLHEGRQFLLGNLFSRMEVGIDTGPHLGLFSLNLDQSVVGLDSEYGADIPLRNLTSEAEAELLYVFRAARVIGPYLRGNVRTSYAEQHFFPDEDTEIHTRNEDGQFVQRSEVSAGERLRLFEALSPVVVQEGVGANLTLVDIPIVDITLRGGVAARQAFYRGGRFIDDHRPGTLDLVEIDDRQQFGGEAIGVAGLRLANAFAINTRFDSFLSHEIFTGDEERFPFRWESRATWQLNRFASATYSFTLRRDEVVVENLQKIHGLALTLQWAILGGLTP